MNRTVGVLFVAGPPGNSLIVGDVEETSERFRQRHASGMGRQQQHQFGKLEHARGYAGLYPEFIDGVIDRHCEDSVRLVRVKREMDLALESTRSILLASCVGELQRIGRSRNIGALQPMREDKLGLR